MQQQLTEARARVVSRPEFVAMRERIQEEYRYACKASRSAENASGTLGINPVSAASQERRAESAADRYEELSDAYQAAVDAAIADELAEWIPAVGADALAAAIGVDRTTIQHHCREGHLPGAVKAGRDWLIPARYADPESYRAAVGKCGRRPKP